MKSLAGNYFTSRQDPVYDYMTAMQKVYDAGATDTATKVGWTIGRLVAQERLTSSTTTGAAGGAFLISVMQCMADVSGATGPFPALTIPAKFSSNAAAILNSGIWEVRGGTTNSQLPAAGRVSVNGARSFGEPRWGAEAANGNWPGVTQYAVYGFPTNIGNPVINAATSINQNETPANAFELGTIPDGTPKTGTRVGVCIGQDVTSGVANRIVHSNSQVLDADHLTQLCDPALVASIRSQPAWYADALARVGRLLAPAPLFALSGFDDCGNSCIGGLPSDWSPFSPGGVQSAAVVLSFDQQPGDAVAVPPGGATNDQVIVHARANGLNMPGVIIDSIAVYNNSGSPAGAIVTANDLPQTTNGSGVATVHFAIGKPGGYLIVVSATLDGTRTQSATSKMFHIKNP